LECNSLTMSLRPVLFGWSLAKIGEGLTAAVLLSEMDGIPLELS